MRIRSAENQVRLKSLCWVKVMPLAAAWGAMSSRMVPRSSPMSKFTGSSFILPLSILDMSRMSLMRPSR